MGWCFYSFPAPRRRLDCYLVYLQQYAFQKQQPLPIDIDFCLTDTLEQLRYVSCSVWEAKHRRKDQRGMEKTCRPGRRVHAWRFALLRQPEVGPL